MNTRELATILAALRYWQREGLASCGYEHGIATDHGQFGSLSESEIDTLCERLNAGEPIVLASIPANTSAADMLAAFRKIHAFSDLEMRDGDAARELATRFIDPEAKQPSTDSEAIACLREVMDFWKHSTDDEMPRELFDRANRLIGADSGEPVPVTPNIEPCSKRVGDEGSCCWPKDHEGECDEIPF